MASLEEISCEKFADLWVAIEEEEFGGGIIVLHLL